MSKLCARKNDFKTRKRLAKSKQELDTRRLRLKELEPSQISKLLQLESIATGLGLLARKSSLCQSHQGSKHKREPSLRMNQHLQGVQNSELKAKQKSLFTYKILKIFNFFKSI